MIKNIYARRSQQAHNADRGILVVWRNFVSGMQKLLKPRIQYFILRNGVLRNQQEASNNACRHAYQYPQIAHFRLCSEDVRSYLRSSKPFPDAGSEKSNLPRQSPSYTPRRSSTSCQYPQGTSISDSFCITRSISRANPNTRQSANRGPTTCNPTGNRRTNPTGTDTAGTPQ